MSGTPPPDVATADQTDAERAAALDEQERAAETTTWAQDREREGGYAENVPMPHEDLPEDPIGTGIPEPIEYDEDDEPQTYRVVTLEFASTDPTAAVWGKVHGLIQSAEGKGFRLMDGSVEDTTLVTPEDFAALGD